MRTRTPRPAASQIACVNAGRGAKYAAVRSMERWARRGPAHRAAERALALVRREL
jgi:hypothetical protein